jgi:hypothetical protein
MVDEPAMSDPDELIRYRRAGGMAGLDQRLTVFGDGRAMLEDRRARTTTETEASGAEVERLGALIAQIPADRWHSALGALGRALLPRPHEGMRFELRRGSDRISGHAGKADADLAALLAELDELLARSVRAGRD